ncbi:glycosyl hydrolase, partial [Streptomyces sp. SID7982]|nr:glycosyl hydrolase [Streptomyces sp. SID7982]
DPSRLTLTGRNTVAEWLAHPVGGPLLMKAFAEGRAAAGGGPSAMENPAIRRFLAGTPLDVIAEFPQSPVRPEEVVALAEQAAAVSGARGR